MTEDFKRKLTAVLSADVVGYSLLMSEDEVSTVKTLETYKNVMSSLIKQHRGRVVDSPGDNLLAEFGSVVDAVQCAVSIQKELQTRNANLPEKHKMEFRIGINLGDVIEEEDRIYGDGVNIAARLEALADPGGICISKTAFDYIENKLPFGYSFIGEQTVKNIAKPIGAYKVLMEARLIDKNNQKAITPIWRKKGFLSFGIIVILAMFTVLYWKFYSRGISIESEQIAVVTDLKKTHKTIAVLPFEDLSPEKDQEHFVLGLSEEILNSLAQIPDLNVKARTSSFSFKGQSKTIQEIASVLGVDHILEGSVRKAGSAIRIIAQLIKVDDESHLWSETYDKEFKIEEMFSVQEDIATAVADELKLSLGVGSLKQLGGTDNLEAYELYLVAIGLGNQPQLKLDSSLFEPLNRAIALDPDFALAWALKSGILVNFAWASSAEQAPFLLDMGLEAAQRAIDIEPNLVRAYFALGFAHLQRGEYIKAEKAYRQGMKLKTLSVEDYEYGLTEHHMTVGNLKKCNELLTEIRQNDPFSVGIPAGHMFSIGLLGDIEGAEKEHARNKTIYGNQYFNGDRYITMLRLDTKNALSNDEIEDVPIDRRIFTVAKKHIKSPKEGLIELQRIFENENDLTSREIYEIAIWAAYFGDHDFSFDAIERSVTIAGGIGVFHWLPVLHEVRQLPRFKKFMTEIGIVDYWKEYGWPDLCRPVNEDNFECD